MSFAHKTVKSFLCRHYWQAWQTKHSELGIGSVSSELYGFKPNSCKWETSLEKKFICTQALMQVIYFCRPKCKMHNFHFFSCLTYLMPFSQMLFSCIYCLVSVISSETDWDSTILSILSSVTPSWHWSACLVPFALISAHKNVWCYWCAL